MAHRGPFLSHKLRTRALSLPVHTLTLSLSLSPCLVRSTPIYPTANNSHSPSNGQISPYHQQLQQQHQQQQQKEHGYYKTTIPVGVSAGSGSSSAVDSCSHCSHCCRTADLCSRALVQERLGKHNHNNNNNENHNIKSARHSHTHTCEGTSNCDDAAAATAIWRSSRVCKNHTTTTTTTLEYELSNFAKLTTQISTQHDVDQATAAAVAEGTNEALPPSIISSSHWQQLQQSLHALHHQQQPLTQLLGNSGNVHLQQTRNYSSSNNNNMSKNEQQRDRLGLWGTGGTEIGGQLSGLERLRNKHFSKVSEWKNTGLLFFYFPQDYALCTHTDTHKHARACRNNLLDARVH